MATGTLISVSEYLNTSYDPDCDYVDGSVVERNLGELDHSRLQTAIAIWLGIHQREWNILPVVEQRVQVLPSRFRIPDVCVLSRDQPMEPIVRVPPLVCIEVLSKDDTLRCIREKVDDYLNFEVKNVWILDPARRDALVADRSGYHAPQSEVLSVPGTPIHLPLPQIFAELD
jgi:Uma2 family endonuclease